jgi:hypothetical protein
MFSIVAPRKEFIKKSIDERIETIRDTLASKNMFSRYILTETDKTEFYSYSVNTGAAEMSVSINFTYS